MFGICFFMLKPPPQSFCSNVLATSPDESKPKSLFDRAGDLMRINGSQLFEIASVLVRFGHVACFIINADRSIV